MIADLPLTNSIIRNAKRPNYVPRQKHLDSNSSPLNRPGELVSSLEGKDPARRGHTKEELGVSDPFAAL